MTFSLAELAAFVCRQSDNVHLQRQHVSGVSRAPGSLAGLTPADHHAIAMVGAVLLRAGRRDAYASPHLLLEACMHPLGTWLHGVAGDVEASWEQLVLLDPDTRVPTLDCRALAGEFEGVVAEEEENTFRELLAQIRKLFGSGSRGQEVYSGLREYIVRNPVVAYDAVTKFLLSIHAPQLAGIVTGSIYQPVTAGAVANVRLCKFCGSIVRIQAGMHCPLRQCRSKHKLELMPQQSAAGLLRASHGAMLYWIGPGLDEIFVFDQLRAVNLPAALYPDFDACDVAIGDSIGIDLKSYMTPFALARRLNRSIGRLALYERRIIGLGDELLVMNPDYARQLRQALRSDLGLEVLTVSEILKEFVRA